MARDQEHRFNKTEYQEAETEVYPMVSAQIMEMEAEDAPGSSVESTKNLLQSLG